MLRGDYVNESDGEKLYYSDREYVKLMYASSGQQEVLWILLLIFIRILEQRNKVYGRIVFSGGTPNIQNIPAFISLQREFKRRKGSYCSKVIDYYFLHYTRSPEQWVKQLWASKTSIKIISIFCKITTEKSVGFLINKYSWYKGTTKYMSGPFLNSALQ